MTLVRVVTGTPSRVRPRSTPFNGAARVVDPICATSDGRGIDAVQVTPPVEHGISKSHAASRRRRLRPLLEHAGAPLSKQSVRNGRPYVARAAHHSLQKGQSTGAS